MSKIKYTEAQFLGAVAGRANESLMIPLSNDRRDGRLYFLSDSRFSTSEFRSGMARIYNPQGKPYDNSLDAFIEDKATEPGCLGLVPVTEFTLERLEDSGWVQAVIGLVLKPENYPAVAYRLE